MLSIGPVALSTQDLTLIGLALLFPLFHFLRSRAAPSSSPPIVERKPETTNVNEKTELKSVMQPARTDLAPPKDDPITVAELRQYDGSDPSKPIYVAIKGTVFDVTHKRDTYGPGKSYNLFAGKDASKALGMSSLKEEDAVSDYSGLSEADTKTLNDWHSFFSKRYNIVGRVVDLPPHASQASNL